MCGTAGLAALSPASPGGLAGDAGPGADLGPGVVIGAQALGGWAAPPARRPEPGGTSQDAELARLLAAGARPADVAQRGDEGWQVLADPEGNEFCLLRWLAWRRRHQALPAWYHHRTRLARDGKIVLLS